jgi:hypothetical protein
VCRGMPRCPWDVCGGGPGAGLVGFLWGHAEGLRRPTWLDLTDLGPRPSGAGSRLSPALSEAAALHGLSSSLICWGRVIPGHAGGAARPGPVPAWSRLVSGVGHDAVVGAAGAGAAGTGAVAAEHLRGGPAVEFHQVSLGAAAVQPGVAEVMPKPVRVQAESALPAAAGDHLVDAGGGQRLPVAGSEPQLGPPGLGVPGAGPLVPVQAPGGLVADPDDPVLAALAADGECRARPDPDSGRQ